MEKIGLVVDITNKLNQFMEDNSNTLKEYAKTHGLINTLLYFKTSVNDKGPLDIKLQDEWMFDEGKTYIYYGRVLRYDDPGNINFGYTGAAIYPRVILCAGAGVNQISKYGFTFGDVLSFYDDPRDNYMIKYGYMLYRKSH